jgi:VanZ family protein
MGLSRTAIAAFRIALAVTLAVTCFLAFTDRELPVINGVSDKVRHAAAFATLALLVDFAFPASRFGAVKVMALLGYGVAIEVVQYFLPARDASALDVLADGAGVAMYALAVPVLKRLHGFRLRWQFGSGP